MVESPRGEISPSRESPASIWGSPSRRKVGPMSARSSPRNQCARAAVTPLAGVFLVALLWPAPVLAEEITTYTSQWESRITGIREVGGRWVLATEKEAIPLEQVVHIRYADQLLEGALPGVVAFLTNGDRLAGQVHGGSALGITIRNSALLKTDIGLELIRALVFPPNIPADHTVGTVTDRLLARKSRRDEVLLRAGSETEGIIQKFGPISLEIATKRLGNLTIPYEKVSAVRIFEETPPPKEVSFRATVCLNDGSRITGVPGVSGEREIAITSTILGKVTIPTSRILSIYFQGGRTVYVSDLTPEKVDATPFFPSEFPWRPYLNRDMSYGGGPITLGGVVYPKGLGCHSKVEATYLLGKQYRSLEGILGIDDEAADGKGNVIFRVLLDGREVYSSGEVNHGDGAKAMQVDVQEAEKMTLVVDYGKNIHIQDRADWADLRLTKMRASR